MGGLDIAALVILGLICLLFLGLFCLLAMWPGRVAAERNHPYTDAIQIGGWTTLLFGGIFWPLVLVWAYSTKNSALISENETSSSGETEVAPRSEQPGEE